MQLRDRVVFSFFCLLSMTSSGHSGVPGEVSLPRLDKRDSSFSLRGETLYLHNHPFKGIQVERYGNGAIYRESFYEMGKKGGIEKQFSLDGDLRALWHYKGGKKEGEQNGWYENGARRFLYHYKNGALEGEQIEWHQNGVVFRQQVFHNGYESARKVLYSGGEIFTNYVKRDQRKYGVDGGALCFEKKKDGEK